MTRLYRFTACLGTVVLSGLFLSTANFVHTVPELVEDISSKANSLSSWFSLALGIGAASFAKRVVSGILGWGMGF